MHRGQRSSLPPERKMLVIIIITSILFAAMEQAEPQPFESELCASTFQLRLGGGELGAHRFGGRAAEGGAGGNDGVAGSGTPRYRIRRDRSPP